MKYRINLPKPSAKRLKNKRLIIECWSLDHSVQYLEINCDDYFEFDFDDELSSENDYFRHELMDDGHWKYHFYVEFSNETRTRVEKYKVEVEPIMDSVLPDKESNIISKKLEEDKQSLIKLIEWYRDEYHKSDFCHTELIERIRKIQNEKELSIYEQIPDGWLRNE